MIEFDLTGRAGVVTGAGKGIGEAVARELAGLGAQLVCCARTQADIDRLVAKIKAAGGQAVGFAGDVRRYDDMERLAGPASTPTARSISRCPTPASTSKATCPTPTRPTGSA